MEEGLISYLSQVFCGSCKDLLAKGSFDCFEYEKNQISVGPWGGQGGTMFNDGLNKTIRQMVIGHGLGIDSIQTEYDREVSSVWSGKHGGVGGAKVDKVRQLFIIFPKFAI
ncbi:hypothetical protein GIB67_026747 [Kingdonia uniflora]|uniref:Jacalin-type lectin domain-containing protein n=1 Tax=Kingdonia uniflora TaxID=39325 RepID=A0A7J7MHG0_9MAGN|nr:hypothetical protein GIB67_026747 [Kingdonia uniflora]